MKHLLIIALLLLAPAVHAADDGNQGETRDPWQGLNRVTHKFNHVLDRFLLLPVAKVYKTVAPGFVQAGTRRFFDNLDDIDNAVNDLLQGKPSDAFGDIGRLAINTTIGVGGWFDPATKFGLKKHEEDFGQTLSVWGVPRGPYLVLPFLGPSTVTDAVGRPFDAVLNPVRYLYPVDHRNTLYGTSLISTRASLLSAESAVFGDEYIFYRDAYLQRREFLIHDGKVKDPFADDF